jgi:hypothetical protein
MPDLPDNMPVLIPRRSHGFQPGEAPKVNTPQRRWSQKLETLEGVREEMSRIYGRAHRGRIEWDDALKRTAILDKVKTVIVAKGVADGTISADTAADVATPDLPRMRRLFERIANSRSEARAPAPGKNGSMVLVEVPSRKA